MGKLNIEHLHKKWVHSKEDDTESEMVYLPATYQFGHLREGRNSLDFKPDGNLLITQEAGPDDRQIQKTTNWKIEGSTLVLSDQGIDKNKIKILSLVKDRLVLEK